ncbi:MAG: glycosyltransferase family 9 protein, partial [Gammaproteobacteria bacterium]
LEKAIFYYRLAISYKPNYPSAHWNLSLALLSDGNFSEGWSEYEWRFFSRAYKDIRNDFLLSGEGFKRWQGESLKGKSLLVIAEQGRGDAIQFVRFLPLLKKQKCRLILQVREELIPLFKCMPEIDSFCTSLREAEHCDYYFQLMSLTDYFKLEETDIIKSGKPYLSTNIQITVPSSERKLKVGFAYKGSEHHTHDKYRSIKPEQLLPLVTQPDCQFYSLQKETSSFVTPITEKVIDLKPFMQDFAYTAALIMQMDLIITVDTALAHVAGALGKPTWILISTKPDWRWMLDRTDSIWYPSVRLYRQTKSDSWSDVIEDIRRDLEAMVQER